MKIDSDTLAQVKQIFASLKHKYSFTIECNPALDDAKSMIEFFTDFASASDSLSVDIAENNSDKAVARLARDGSATGISFRCIPGGHEFTSLLLAVLNADGQGRNLPDEAVARRIAGLKGPIALTTYVTLECTNCPDVVQALNVMALANDSISNEAVDGNLAVAEVEALDVKSVPTVFANGERIWSGKASLGELLDVMEQRFGSDASAQPGEPVVHEADLVVVGAGPAGAAAAIYSARKGQKVAVVCSRIGGQVNDTEAIDNLIAVDHTTGPLLGASLGEHLKSNGVEVYDNRTLESVDLRSERKTLTVRGGEQFVAPQVVIATGAGWRKLGVKGESDYLGKGVAFCVHCDGPFYAGKDVAVVGGGNSGIEAAIDLAAICRHVDVFEFLDTLKADSVLQEKLRSLPNVDVHLSSAVTEVKGDGRHPTAISVTDRNTSQSADYPEAGIFVQIGLVPNTQLFATELQLNKGGEIVTDGAGRTDVKGVYAAGDCTDVPYKQIVIALGEGAKAALSAFDDRVRGVVG